MNVHEVPSVHTSFAWDSAIQEVRTLAIRRITTASLDTRAVERAYTYCALLGADIEGRIVSHSVLWRGIAYGCWGTEERAVVAFCVALNLDIGG